MRVCVPPEMFARSIWPGLGPFLDRPGNLGSIVGTYAILQGTLSEIRMHSRRQPYDSPERFPILATYFFPELTRIGMA